MPLRLDLFQYAYRIAHAAGWDEANRRKQREGRAAWNAADWDHAVATFVRVMAALGFSDLATASADADACPPEPERPAPHGKPALLRRQPRHPARAYPR